MAQRVTLPAQNSLIDPELMLLSVHNFMWCSCVNVGLLQPPRNIPVGCLVLLNHPLGVNECVMPCKGVILSCKGIPSRVWSCLMSSVPGIDPDSTLKRLWGKRTRNPFSP